MIVRTLAEFIMRGRIQAVTVAMVSAGLPLIPHGTIGVVTLRKGWQEGLLVLMWALLPALAGIWISNAGKGLVFGTVAVLVVTYLAALVLRTTMSWVATLFSLVLLSVASTLLVVLLAGDLADEMAAVLRRFLTHPDQTPSPVLEEWLQQWNIVLASGFIAVLVGFGTLGGLLVARWWQAILYNPGGFQKEFHTLRLNSALAFLCIVASGYCLVGGAQYQWWLNLFLLPPLVAGLGIVHCAIAKYRLGLGSVIALYIFLFIVSPLLLVLAMVGLTDVWLNYRKRFNLLQP